ncbi:hypothetical protein PAXRUDRAFT_821024, partial [Paxillus rubicundulus Ve08.2h10]
MLHMLTVPHTLACSPFQVLPWAHPRLDFPILKLPTRPFWRSPTSTNTIAIV